MTIVNTQVPDHHNNNNQKRTTSAEPVAVPTTSCVIVLQGFARSVAHGAMMPGTALVRTMINDYMKVRNTLRFYLRIKTAQLSIRVQDAQ